MARGVTHPHADWEALLPPPITESAVFDVWLETETEPVERDLFALARVEAALQELPEHYRGALRARYWTDGDERTYDEVGAVRRCSTKAAENRVMQ